MEYLKIKEYLYNNIDESFKEFTSRIINTNYLIQGVRTPIIKSLAKEISKNNIENVLNEKNKTTYEEIILEGFLIGYIKDVKESIKYFNKYIKKIDNWAMCDQVVANMKIVKKNKNIFYKEINKYLNSNKPYIVRVGLILLLDYYIEESYLDDIYNICNNIKTDEYYINMAIAWLLSICFIKYPDKTMHYLLNSELDKFVFNKTISKICDSLRVDKNTKIFLKSLKK